MIPQYGFERNGFAQMWSFGAPTYSHNLLLMPKLIQVTTLGPSVRHLDHKANVTFEVVSFYYSNKFIYCMVFKILKIQHGCQLGIAINLQLHVMPLRVTILYYSYCEWSFMFIY
jgi:hypothetical protein